MKTLYFLSFTISCGFILLISPSCKKDSISYSRPICDTCAATPSQQLFLTTLYITDSNWVAQSVRGAYESDITSDLHKADASPGSIYSIEIVGENGLQQIYPNYHVKYMGGTIFGSVYSWYDNEVCMISFGFSDEDRHYGELPFGGALPFHSVKLKILLF